MKAGTSCLHVHLGLRPQIYMYTGIGKCSRLVLARYIFCSLVLKQFALIPDE